MFGDVSSALGFVPFKLHSVQVEGCIRNVTVRERHGRAGREQLAEPGPSDGDCGQRKLRDGS
jgi:hypothetical protein